LRNEQTVSSVVEVCDEVGFLACVETGTIVRFAKPATKFSYQLRRTTSERADLCAGLPVTDRTCAVGNVNRDEIRGILALRAVARLTIHGRTGTVEDDFEAKIGVGDATLRPCEPREDALALAPQVLDRLEQVAAPDQVSRI